jgi:hypothetical protein
MGPKALRHGYFCGDGFCTGTASYYVVLKADGKRGRRAESRSRRCEACARHDAKIMGVPFPDPSSKASATNDGGVRSAPEKDLVAE